MNKHVRWEPRGGRGSEAVRAGYEAAKRAYEVGRAVRARRLELGMSQTELAERADTTQSAISRSKPAKLCRPWAYSNASPPPSADLVVTLTPKAA